MTQIRNINFRNPETIAWVAIGLFLLLNISICLFQVFNKLFNPDELQHLHIAWLVANGDILYQDFWEHHGPLYGLLNGVIVYLLEPEPSLDILFGSRLLSLVFTCITMALIWLIARQLNLSRIGAFLTVAIYSSLLVIQTRGLEMRPDPLQSMFWIGGLYLLIRNQSNGSLRQAIIAGALMTLAILSNAKAGIGPFFVVIFYLLGYWLCNLNWADIWRDMRGMMIGACLAAAPFLIYFWLNEALFDFIYYNFLWNAEVIFYWSATELQQKSGPLYVKSIALKNLEFFMSKQLPFLLLTGIGTFFLGSKLGSKTDTATRRRYWLFAIATLGSTLGWLLDLYNQYFLMFLPLWSILSAYALLKVTSLLSGINQSAGLAAGSLITAVAATVMLWNAIDMANFTEEPRLRAQKEFTERFVAMTDRDEPVGNIWNQCGGYMFNKNVGYYWTALSEISETIKVMTGVHPHGQGFIDEMEERQVRYVIGLENWLTEGMSDEAMAYLRENFEYSDCLWTRKEQ